MIMEISGSLPRSKDIDGVPVQFLKSPPKSEFVQIDMGRGWGVAIAEIAERVEEAEKAEKSEKAKPPNDFNSQYRQFYADLYAFHKKHYGASTFEELADISIGLSELDGKYSGSEFCRKVSVEVVNEIERCYVEMCRRTGAEG